MALDISLFNKPQERWVTLTTPALAGIKLLVQYSSPEAGEEFEKVLVAKKMTDLTKTPLRAYLLEFCRFYIKDWEGPHRGGTPALYDPAELAKVMCSMKSALNEITKAVQDEAAFFTENGKPQT